MGAACIYPSIAIALLHFIRAGVYGIKTTTYTIRYRLQRYFKYLNLPNFILFYLHLRYEIHNNNINDHLRYTDFIGCLPVFVQQ